MTKMTERKMLKTDSKKLQKKLCVLLTVLMMMTMVPGMAFAEGEAEEQNQTQEQQQTQEKAKTVQSQNDKTRKKRNVRHSHSYGTLWQRCSFRTESEKQMVCKGQIPVSWRGI